MSVAPPSGPASTRWPSWNYVEVSVQDGPRHLRPTHVSHDYLIFTEPPQLTSNEIDITISDNAGSDTSRVRVLPHDPSATQIPIQYLDIEQIASVRHSA